MMSENSHRFVNLDESIETFIEKQCNQNTISKTHRDIELLKKFLASENEGREIHNIEPKVLNDYISAFIVKVRKQDGGEYEPTTVRSFISSFDRFLRKKNYPTTIIEGAEFRKTRDSLAAKQRELLQTTKLTIFIGLNLLGSANGERDPVLFYHQYTSKRPDDMNNKDSPFYIAINHTKNPASGKPWFKSAPMGVNKLNSLLKTMAQKAKLDTSNLSNHSARKRMIQKLSEQNVPPTHIMQESGHKNVQRINNYSSLSVQQQKDISNILTVTGRTNSAIDRATFSKTIVDVEQKTEQMSTHQLVAMFHGARISGGTFDITVNTLNQSPTMPSATQRSRATASEPDEKRRRHYFIESDIGYISILKYLQSNFIG